MIFQIPCTRIPNAGRSSATRWNCTAQLARGPAVPGQVQERSTGSDCVPSTNRHFTRVLGAGSVNVSIAIRCAATCWSVADEPVLALTPAGADQSGLAELQEDFAVLPVRPWRTTSA